MDNIPSLQRFYQLDNLCNYFENNSSVDEEKTKKNIRSGKLIFCDVNLANTEQRQAAQKYFETLSLFCCKTENQTEFKKAIDNLTVIYDMQDEAQFNERKCVIMSLQLLYLLSNNQFVQFHMLLETLPSEAFSNKYISYVVKLEKSFNIGNYTQVLAHAYNPPLQEMNVFLKKVNDTIKYAMARSAEVAYDYIKVQDALKLFSLASLEQLKKFIYVQEVQGKKLGVSWKLQGDKLYFKEEKVSKRTLDSMDTMKNLFQYANELEKIV